MGRQTDIVMISRLGVWQAEVGINQGYSRGALACLRVERGRAREGFPEEVGQGVGVGCSRWVGPCAKCLILLITVRPHTSL